MQFSSIDHHISHLTKFKIQIPFVCGEIKNKIHYGQIGLIEIVWGSESNLKFVHESQKKNCFHGLSGQNRFVRGEKYISLTNRKPMQYKFVSFCHLGIGCHKQGFFSQPDTPNRSTPVPVKRTGLTGYRQKPVKFKFEFKKLSSTGSYRYTGLPAGLTGLNSNPNLKSHV